MKTLLASLALLLAAASAEAREWVADNNGSRLGFSAWRALPNADERETFDAVITVWRAEIRFDPAAPDAARLFVEMDVGSINTGDGGLNAEMTAEGWLAAGAHPTATYAAAGFTPLGDGRYRADGLLTLRGVSAPVPLEFELKIEADNARATGGASVPRLDFDVGAHAGAGIAAPIVGVGFEIRAAPKE